MFSVFVTMDVVADHLESFREAVTQVAAASLALEAGCSAFDVLESVEVPGRFHLYEVYASEEAFVLVHKGTDHFRAFVARSTPFIVPGSKNELHAVRITAETTERDHDH